MPKVHVARQGECLSSVASMYGFSSHRDLYEHAENAQLRKERPDPAVIFPGDRIVIPEASPMTWLLATGQRHVIVVKSPVVKVRVYLRDRGGEALSDQPYVLRYQGGEKSGQTTFDGLVEQVVPASTEEATVEIPALDLKLKLRCGTVDPIETVSGVQVRLNNLGFGAGPVDGMLGSRTRDAIERFQEANALTASGELDDATRRKLVEAHGC